MTDRTPNYMGMEKSLYNKIRSIIQDYDRQIDNANDLLMDKGLSMDGLPHGTGTTDPTGDTATKRENRLREPRAVAQALLEVPEYYREALWEWEHDRIPLHSLAHAYVSPSTLYRYKRVWFYGIARILDL